MINTKYFGKDVAVFFREYDKKYSEQITIEQYITMKQFDVAKGKNISVDYDKLISLFNQITGKKIYTITDKVKNAIVDRLEEGFSKEDFKNAIINCYHDDHHKETNRKYLTLEFITRPDKMLRFSSMENVKGGIDSETDEQRTQRLLQKEKEQWG